MTLQEAVERYGERRDTPVGIEPYNDRGVRRYARVLGDYEIIIRPYHASFIEPEVQVHDTALWKGELVTVVSRFGLDKPLRLKPNVLTVGAC